MKIQKKLLYGILVIGAIAVLYYYGNKMKGSPAFSSGGDVGGTPTAGNQPPVPPAPVAAPVAAPAPAAPIPAV